MGARWRDRDALLAHIPFVLLIEGVVLIGPALAFGIGRSAAIRTGLFLSQFGEFAFVLLGAATVAWLLSNDGQTLAMLVVAASMIATPLMVKAGAVLADRFGAAQDGASATVNADLDRHVVIVGYDERDISST